MALLWRRDRSVVDRILLPSANGWTEKRLRRLFPGSRAGAPCRKLDELAEVIVSFLSGRPVSFDLDLLRLDLCPPFQRRVLLAEAGIPRGRVSTYGRMARRIGSPCAARAVGTALAKNPFPVVIPCHRALRSDLSLGGYQGGLAMKRRLLEMEGIRFDHSGRAVVDTIYY
jgi:methylated-DNA-[protein]-cysteine S-methyltransferase